MGSNETSLHVGNYVSQQILICPIHSDLYDEVILAIRQQALKKIQNSFDLVGIVIDVSDVKVMDIHNMTAIEGTLKMAEMLGVKSCLSGLRPALALALVDLGYDSKRINVALNVEQAISHIHRELDLKNQQLGFEEDDADDEIEMNDNEIELNEENKVKEKTNG
jgi:rsbT antagonist protein RsbS